MSEIIICIENFDFHPKGGTYHPGFQQATLETAACFQKLQPQNVVPTQSTLKIMYCSSDVVAYLLCII